ncbi:MAG: protein kinase domain-containing protein, partial [Planctomycetota bacterium]
MYDPAATPGKGGHPLKKTVAKEQSDRAGTGLMKFVYTTGASPLPGYTIKRGVGMGGFGEVYFAQSDAGKEVALKRIQRNLDVEIRGVTQCLNLKHPNLIAIHDIKYDDAGEAWIVMEFVSGESLKEVIERHPSGLPMEKIKFWFTGMAAGVAYLHDHGIVHRDLKPANVFEDEGVIKLGDYGLSKFISCSRRSGQTESVGTFHYMAPEIGKGVYGKEIDVYSLGIMLFEMLTGRIPFEGETSQEIIMKHLTANPDLHRVPPPYRGVIERALFKDPAKRFRSVDEMLRALQFELRRPTAGRGEHDPARKVSGARQATGSATSTDRLYIDEEGIATDEIVFGPVVEVVSGDVEKPPVARSAPANREPIAAAVGTGFDRLSHWWSTANMSTPVKMVLIVVAILALMINAKWLTPAAVFLGVLYVVYLGVRAVVVGLEGEQVNAGQGGAAARHESADRCRRSPNRLYWREQARQTLAQKPLGQRMSELTGSFLMAAAVSAVLSLIILVAVGHNLDASLQVWSLYAWLAVTSVVASWLILGLSKFWESAEGDAVLRRFVMMVAGLVVGVAAYAASQMLMIRLSTDHMFNVLELPPRVIPQAMYTNGTPGVTVFLAFFATLFAVLSWWRQVDPLRPSRFSLFITLLCGLVAAVIPWQIPWGGLLALTISMAIQLSAPWMNSSERNHVRATARAA